jgi:N-formylglutamate amidohydrolase
MGYTVELNKPYSGTIVLLPLYGSGAPVISVMIEVNRRLYMDESNQIISLQFDATKKSVFKILDAITGCIPG